MNVPILDLKAQHATIRDVLMQRVLPVIEGQTFILGQPVLDLARYYYVREGLHFVYLVNTSQTRTHRFTVSLPGHGEVEVWDPESGVELARFGSAGSGLDCARFDAAGARIVVASDDGVDKWAHLVRSYFKMDGHHIQFNVVSASALREAQAHPGQHRDLIVRVAGYSDYFCDLSTALQDEIIERTEHEGF